MTRPTLQSLIPLALWLLGLVSVLMQGPVRADDATMAVPCHAAVAAASGEGAHSALPHAHAAAAGATTPSCVERCCPAVSGSMVLPSTAAAPASAAGAEAPAIAPATRWVTQLQVPETPPPIG